MHNPEVLTLLAVSLSLLSSPRRLSPAAKRQRYDSPSDGPQWVEKGAEPEAPAKKEVDPILTRTGELESRISTMHLSLSLSYIVYLRWGVHSSCQAAHDAGTDIRQEQVS